MKESDITPKIIELSKELAKHWRMEIYGGCWYYYDAIPFGQSQLNSHTEGGFQEWVNEQKNPKIFIPIPSISDCLDKLSGLKEGIELWRNTRDYYWYCRLGTDGMWKKGMNPHEALLSALLKVVKQ